MAWEIKDGQKNRVLYLNPVDKGNAAGTTLWTLAVGDGYYRLELSKAGNLTVWLGWYVYDKKPQQFLGKQYTDNDLVLNKMNEHFNKHF